LPMSVSEKVPMGMEIEHPKTRSDEFLLGPRILSVPDTKDSMAAFETWDNEFKRMEKEMKKMRKDMFGHLKNFEKRLF